MAYSNCCNCSGNCGSHYGNSYARHNNNSWCRNNYTALNTAPDCSRCRNYPFYTGNCPNACGCYNCGCTAGVTNQNIRGYYGWRNVGDSCGCSACTSARNSACCGECGRCNGCNTCSCGSCNECDDCNGCGCGCDDCNCGCGTHNPVYGLFSANVPLTVTAGAAVPLVPTAVSTNDFTVAGGAITVNRCGVYLATYTANIPIGAEVDTTLVLNVNGAAQPSTLQTVSTPGSYTGQTVFTANAGSTVSLISSAALSLTEPIGQNVVNLTLTRIG